MRGDDPDPALAEILKTLEDRPAGDAAGKWPTLTAESLALLHIADCAEQLRRSELEPLRLAQAAKSSHAALHSALVAALSGSMGIGAYDAKLEKKWRNFLQEGTGEPPESWRVMYFKGLLEKARESELEWSKQPLQLNAGDDVNVLKLEVVRDGIEHSKPGVWVIEPA